LRSASVNVAIFSAIGVGGVDVDKKDEERVSPELDGLEEGYPRLIFPLNFLLDEEGALRFLSRCLSELVRTGGCDMISGGDVEGVGGKGASGGGKGLTILAGGTGDAGMDSSLEGEMAPSPLRVRR
jgi:hypothetical protein